MLKKVMIICIAFSFVFIGGIAFAAGEQPEPPKEGQNVSVSDVTPPAEPPGDLIIEDSKNIVKEGVKKVEEGVEEDVEEGVKKGVELKNKVIDLKDKVGGKD